MARIDSCNVDDVAVRQDGAQTSLYDHGNQGETYVAIARRPNEEMRGCCDEIDKRLAPSDKLLQEWLDKREELQTEMSPDAAHNRALDVVNYESRFRDELDEDVIEEYADRVADGENIVLVCHCGSGRRCHRRIVRQLVHDAIDAA